MQQKSVGSTGNVSTLSIEQKIRLLRKSKEINQDGIAAMLLTTQRRISRIERGEVEYTENELKSLKEHFDIEGMPLTVFECEAFKGRLYVWLDEIRSKDIHKAKETQKELYKITNLEACDFELFTLYRLFEALLSVAEGDTDTAKKILQSLEVVLDAMTEEHRYYYNFHMGALNATLFDFETALRFYHQALDVAQGYNGVLPDGREKIYYNIAVCYNRMELTSHSILFLSEIPKTSFEDKMTTRSLGIDIMRATNCYKIGLYTEAEKILNDCLVRATSIDSKLYIGLSLYHLGVVRRYLEDWERAVEYFNQAKSNFIGNTQYAEYLNLANYMKIRCIIGLRKFNEIEKELKKSIPELKTIDEYPIFLEALKHIMHLHRNNSNYNINAVRYLENTAIPSFLKNSIRFEALDCYTLILRHEEKSGTQKKIISISKAMYEILRKDGINL